MENMKKKPAHRRQHGETTPTMSKLAAAVISTSFLFAQPVRADTPPALKYRKPPEVASAEPTLSQMQGRRAEVAFPGGTATVTDGLRDPYFTNFVMHYNMKDVATAPFVFSGPVGTGNVLYVLPGRERTVVITENNVIVTLGYEAVARGETALVMNGVALKDSNTYYYNLPEDVRGVEELADGRRVPRLQSAIMIEDGDGQGETLFFIGRNGHLRATRVERYSEPYARASIEVNEYARLMSAGSVAILAEPGRGVMLALTADFDTHRIVKHAIPLPVTPEGIPEINGTDGNFILAFSNIQVLVLVGEPGNPNSVTIATVGGQ